MAERLEFKKTTVAALPVPTNARSTYYDTEIPKLAVLVTKAGSRTFYVVKRAGREMVWLKLGVFPDMTVERARKEAQKILGEFATDKNPAAVRRALKKNQPCLSFLQMSTDLATVKNYRLGATIFRSSINTFCHQSASTS